MTEIYPEEHIFPTACSYVNACLRLFIHLKHITNGFTTEE